MLSLSFATLQLFLIASQLQQLVARPLPKSAETKSVDRTTPVLRMYSVAHPLISAASDKSDKFDFNLDMSDFQFAPNDQTDFSFAFDHGGDNSVRSSKSFDREDVESNDPSESSKIKNNHDSPQAQSYSNSEDNLEDSPGESPFKPIIERNYKNEPKEPKEVDFNDDFFASSDPNKSRKSGFSSSKTRPAPSEGIKPRNNPSQKSDYDVALEVDDSESDALRPTFTIEGGDDKAKMRDEDYNHEPEPPKPKLHHNKRAKGSQFNSRKPDTDTTYQDK